MNDDLVMRTPISVYKTMNVRQFLYIDSSLTILHQNENNLNIKMNVWLPQNNDCFKQRSIAPRW